MFLHVDSKDSDQTGRMPRLIWVFAGHKGHFVGFVMRWLNYHGWFPCFRRISFRTFRTDLWSWQYWVCAQQNPQNIKHTAGTQISLCICSLISLCCPLKETFDCILSLEGQTKTDQIVQMQRLIRVFTGCKSHLVGFAIPGLVFLTLNIFQHSFIQAYCILFRANPRASLLRVIGDWPISSMSCLTFWVTSGFVNGAGTISTRGTKYGGFIYKTITMYHNDPKFSDR